MNDVLLLLLFRRLVFPAEVYGRHSGCLDEGGHEDDFPVDDVDAVDVCLVMDGDLGKGRKTGHLGWRR